MSNSSRSLAALVRRLTRALKSAGILALASCGVAVPAERTQMPEPPGAAKKPVVDQYHGVKVTDDYRWLERAGTILPCASGAMLKTARRAYLGGLAVREPIGKCVISNRGE